jgi:hypothetical protein
VTHHVVFWLAIANLHTAWYSPFSFLPVIFVPQVLSGDSIVIRGVPKVSRAATPTPRCGRAIMVTNGSGQNLCHLILLLSKLYFLGWRLSTRLERVLIDPASFFSTFNHEWLVGRAQVAVRRVRGVQHWHCHVCLSSLPQQALL